MSFNPGGAGYPCKSGADSPRKIQIKPLKETNLGVAQLLSNPRKKQF